MRVLNVVLNNVMDDGRVLKTAQTARNAGWQAFIIGFSKGKEKEIRNLDGVEVILVPNTRWAMEREGTWERDVEKRDMAQYVKKTAEVFTEELVRVRPHLLHTHDMYGLGTGAEMVRAMARRGITCAWIHDAHEYTRGATNISANLWRQAVDQHHRFVREPDTLITVSDAIADKLVDEDRLAERPTVILNLPRKRMERNGQERDIRSSLGLSHETPLVVYSGNIASAARGVGTLIEAMAHMPNVHVAIVSNRPSSFEPLARRAREVGAADRLHLHDYVPIEELTSFLRTATIGCHPMQHFGNGEVAMPNKLFEYIHSGLPLLVSDVESMSAFVKRHSIGEVFEAGNAKSCAQAAAKIIADPGLYSRRISPELVDDCSWETQEPLIMATYQRAISRSADSGSSGETRVLHGPTSAAGQPWATSRGLRRLGVSADAIRLFPEKTKAGYKADYVFDDADKDADFTALTRLAHRYDVFHFYARSFWIRHPDHRFPSAQDLLLLRAAGKCVIFNFRGSEARIPSVFRARCRHHWLKAEADEAEKASEAVQHAYLDFIRAVSSRTVVIDPEMLTYVPDATVIPRAIDLDEWKYEPPAESEVPIIVHAPTNRNIKGTDIVLAAVEGLRAEGMQLELTLVENMPNTKAREIYRSATLIIDQLRIGWHGVLAIEAMAMGRPVLAYIREDLASYFDEPAPLWMTSPETLKEDIRTLLGSPHLRTELAARGRRYVERVHDSAVVAARYRDLYDDARRAPKPVDLRVAISFLRFQDETAKKTQGPYDWARKRLKHLQILFARGGARELLRFARHQIKKRVGV